MLVCLCVISFPFSSFLPSTIGVGDGGHVRGRGGHVPPPPKKKIGKLFFEQLSCKNRAFWGKYHKKFGHVDNFPGKYYAKFGHFVNLLLCPRIRRDQYEYDLVLTTETGSSKMRLGKSLVTEHPHLV